VGEEDERRRGPRVPLSTSFAESDPRTTTPVRDLSKTGVLVATDQLYPLGTRIELRFAVFPNHPELFVHTGRVTRLSLEPPGMGVEFDPLTPDVEELISRILEDAEQARRRRGRRHLTFDTNDLITRKL
jgi:hypothetical protein